MFASLLLIAAPIETTALDLRLRQTGAATALGKHQTLRCLWRAAAPDGRVAEGSRPGWCAGAERAIRAEAAALLGR
jgi:hypothetical protein